MVSASPFTSTHYSNSNHLKLRVVVIGGGIGGLAAAVALRRAGHAGMFQQFFLDN
jgi:monoamine oxidase